MRWTDEQKADLIKRYTDANPTPENSTELCKTLGEEFEQSPNGVRMILVKAGVYVKKDPATPSAASSTKKATGTTGEGAKRVSKESQINALIATIEGLGKEVDKDVIDKLTGKAAAYFDSILKQ